MDYKVVANWNFAIFWILHWQQVDLHLYPQGYFC